MNSKSPKRKNRSGNGQEVTKFPDDFYMTDQLTAHAIEQITRFATTEAPFFVYVGYTAPHFPLHALPEYIQKYQDIYDDGYAVLRERRYHRLREMGMINRAWPLSPPHEQLGQSELDFPVTPWQQIQNKALETRRMKSTDVNSEFVVRTVSPEFHQLSSWQRTGISFSGRMLGASRRRAMVSILANSGTITPHPADRNSYQLSVSPAKHPQSASGA